MRSVLTHSLALPLALPMILVCALVSGCKKDKTGDVPTTADTAGAAPSGSATTFPAPPDVAAPPADAQKTASGLASKVLKPGTGAEKPNEWDGVIVHYAGWTKDGTMFDTSMNGEPVSFKLTEVIPGWTEGMQLMTKGEKRRFWIPAALAYGEKPSRGAPAGQLCFDVELLEIKPGEKPIAAPDDVKEAPKDAKKTASGLAYKVLTPGKGTKHPGPTTKVRVHYTGWTTAGKMFDSSVMRKAPAEFELTHVIKGWTEGVQLMVEGDKVRFWIPADLAYGEVPKKRGAPAGQLTFDVELLQILSAPDAGAPAPKGPAGDKPKQ